MNSDISSGNILSAVKTIFIHEGKAAGACGDHSSTTSAKVKNDGATPQLPHMPSWYSA